MDLHARAVEVIPTRQAREGLPSVLKDFREQGTEATPVFFGAHRKPEGVMISYLAYQRLVDSMDDIAIAAEVIEREKTPREEWLSEDQFLKTVGVGREEFEAL